MPILVPIALFGWIPLILVFFAILPPARAVVVSYVLGWLFLPQGFFVFSGIPDYDKMTATTGGVFLGALIFDTPRFFHFRPRWFDLPTAAMCLLPLASDLQNGLTLYASLSDVQRQIVMFAMPYMIGRLYLDRLENFREMALGLVIGALSYVPFCVWEIRFSPQIANKIYGPMKSSWDGTRYGGYRPEVFMSGGLELGMFMCVAFMVAFHLWRRKLVTTLFNWPFGYITAVLGVISIANKATGATFLTTTGLLSLGLAHRFKSKLPVYALIILPWVYVTVRGSGAYSGAAIVDFARNVVGEERAYSLGFRLIMEDRLAEKARQQLWLGWGGEGRYLIMNDYGKLATLVDGFWMICFGQGGIVGLVVMLTMFSLPGILFLRRFAVDDWLRPDIAPAVVLMMIVVLYQIDNLMNAMIAPVYFVIAGGVISLLRPPPIQHQSPVADLRDQGDQLVQLARYPEAAAAYRAAIAAASVAPGNPLTLRELAMTHSRLADLDEHEADLASSEEQRRAALALWEMLASHRDADPTDRLGYLDALDELARLLTTRGSDADAIALRRHLALALAPSIRRGRDDLNRWLNAVNDLAWLLAETNDTTQNNPSEAVALAERATAEGPTNGSFWNTLGIARLRAGDNIGAMAALERSIQLGPPGGTAFDLFALAMVLYRLSDHEGAQESYVRAIAWADTHAPGHPGLARFRDEARELLAQSAATAR